MDDIRSSEKTATWGRRLTGRACKQPTRSGGAWTTGQIHDLCARQQGAQADPPTAAVLTPLHSDPRARRVWMAAAFLLGAIARDILDDPKAAGRALQHALDLAEPDEVLFPFLHYPPWLPDRQDRHPSAGGNLTGQAADLLAGAGRPASSPRASARYLQALTRGETRVLQYLPTNLSAPEIAAELYLSVHTVRTHKRHLYQKLGARSRTQAVQQARALGLLASPRTVATSERE